MKFAKRLLQDLVCEDIAYLGVEDEPPVVKTIRKRRLGDRRWEADFELIFSLSPTDENDVVRLFRTSYSRGLTEYQDTSPFEFDSDEIECEEVVSVEKPITVTHYVPKTQYDEHCGIGGIPYPPLGKE